MQVIDEAISRFRSQKPKWTIEDGLILRGLTALFQFTKNPQVRSLILDYMNEGVFESGGFSGMPENPYDPASCGNALIYAWTETREERYRKALQNNWEHIKADPLPDDPWELYGAAPFMAEYDTLFGGKQAYKTIVKQFQQAHAELFDTEKGLYRCYIHQNELGFPLRDEGLMLMALADTIEKLDMQIYEHYRALADLFLIAAKGLIRWQNQDTMLLHGIIDQKNSEIDWGGNAMVIYALRKGVRLSLLDEEKYLPPIRKAFIHLAEHISTSPEPFDAWTAGPLMMAQAEMQEE